MTPGQLREWAELVMTDEYDYRKPSVPDISNQLDAHAALLERHAELEKIAEAMAVLHEKTTFGSLECVVAYRAWRDK